MASVAGVPAAVTTAVVTAPAHDIQFDYPVLRALSTSFIERDDTLLDTTLTIIEEWKRGQEVNQATTKHDRDRRSLRENGLRLFHWCFEKSGMLRPDLHARARAIACDMVVLSTPIIITNTATHSTAAAAVAPAGPTKREWSIDELIMTIKVAMRAAKAFADAASCPVGSNPLAGQEQARHSANQYFQIGCDHWQRGVAAGNAHFVKEHVDIGFSLYWWRSELFYNWPTTNTPNSSSDHSNGNGTIVPMAMAAAGMNMSGTMASRMDESLEFARQSQVYAHDERLRCDAANLAKSLYNKGIAQYNRRDYIRAIQWLRMSASTLEYDINGSGNHERQCRTWRVIALAYMESSQYNDALPSIERSLHYNSNDCDGIYIKAKCFYELKRPAADDTLFELIHNPKASIQILVALCDFASEKTDRYDEVQRAYDELRQRYPNDDCVITCQLRSLIAKAHYDDAGKLLDTIITRDRPLSRTCRSDLLAMCWTVGVATFEGKKWRESIEWLVRCNRMIDITDYSNRGRCYRALSLAHFEATNYIESLLWARQAKVIDPCASSCLHALRALLRAGHRDESLNEFKELINARGFNADDLLLVAEEAKGDYADITLQALEMIFTNIMATKGLPRQSIGIGNTIGAHASAAAATFNDKMSSLPFPSSASMAATALDPVMILRTLIQLSVGLLPPPAMPSSSSTIRGSRAAVRHNINDSKEIKRNSMNNDGVNGTPMDTSGIDDHTNTHTIATNNDRTRQWQSIMERIEKYYRWVREHWQQRFDRLAGSDIMGHDTERSDDIRWFAEQSWNIGIRVAAEKLFRSCYYMFDISSWLFHQLPTSSSNHDSYRMSEVMVMTAALEQAWLTQGDERISLANDALSRVGHIVKASSSGSRGDRVVQLTKLLTLKAKLFINDLDIVNSIKKMGIMDAHILDAIAALALQFDRFDVSVAAMGEHLRLLLHQKPINIKDISKLYRKCLQLSPETAQGTYLDEIIALGSDTSVASLWPGVESRWLVVHAWNQGVYQYRLRQLEAARGTLHRALQLHRLFLPNESIHYESLKSACDYVNNKQTID